MTPRKQKDPRRWMRLRLWIIGGCFVLAGMVLAGRAVDLQLVERGFLSAKARGEILREVKIAPNRGIIYDRNQVELALSVGTDSVYADPAATENPVRDGRRLAKALGLPAGPVIKRLEGKRRFVWIERRVDPDQAEAVRALDLDSVGLVTEPRRFYPYTSLACHLLGFAGLDAKGLGGLELKYNKVLTGRGQRVTRARDALGRSFWLAGQPLNTMPQGRHLILTIDKALQYRVEKILAAAVARWKAVGGQAVVLAPATGEILALASVPAFNPNVYQDYPSDAYRNRAVTDPYEPGSTFKVFMAAAALASGRVTLDKRFDCENGSWQVGGRTIHDTHPHGKLNLSEIVKFSSNIGAAKVAHEVGPVQLHRTLADFGFGRPTGVDLPGESRGILRPAARWKPVELANIAFGQGVAVTPLQLTAAIAAVANNGILMRPFVVKALVDGSGRLVGETQPQVLGRALGASEARLLKGMMMRVTEPGGTGERVKVPGFKVAGKTGTAQKLDPEGGYSHRDFMSSFVGFVPAEDPRAVILVVIDSPRGRHYGGTVAGPAWAAIAQATLKTLGVHRSEPGPRMLQVRQEPRPAPAPLAPAETRAARARALAEGKVPDLGGLTLRQVLALAGRAGLKVEARGWGRVASQSPAPGAPLEHRAPLKVRLSPATGGA